jgi:hypothetical protein
VCLFFFVEKPAMKVKALAQKKIIARCAGRRRAPARGSE